jgi:hypothetical protein
VDLLIEINVLFPGKGMGRAMSRKLVEETLKDIEDNQKALRKSIDQSRQLAEQSERLINIHRKQVEDAAEA